MPAALLQTNHFGGNEGVAFDDVKTNGLWPTDMVIDLKHPIKRIDIRADRVVEGISVTYQVEGTSGRFIDSRAPLHGTRGNTTRVNVKDSEIILAVFGRSGQSSAMNDRDVIISIAFVILDTVTETVRTAGPYGNVQDKSKDGSLFHVSRPIAIAGVSSDGDEEAGLSGLSFFKAHDAI